MWPRSNFPSDTGADPFLLFNSRKQSIRRYRRESTIWFFSETNQLTGIWIVA